MGLSIKQRKQRALRSYRLSLTQEEFTYERMSIASEAIDCYIKAVGFNYCKCGETISVHNKTGMCTNCRRNKWRREHELEYQAQRAREKRARIKKLKEKHESA